MAFNGSGSFARLYNWVSDRNAAIKIRADRMDAEMDGFATGLSTCITKDGQTTITQNIPFNNKRITGLADATADTDALNRQSADTRFNVNSAYDELTTFNTVSTVIPLDDTIPQITEGSQILTATITPRKTTNKVRVRVNVPVSVVTASAAAMVAVFRNGGTNAVAANWRFDAAGSGGSVIVEYVYTPGVVTAETITVRVGVSTTAGGQSIALNGIGAGRLLGGVSRSSLLVEELNA